MLERAQWECWGGISCKRKGGGRPTEECEVVSLIAKRGRGGEGMRVKEWGTYI